MRELTDRPVCFLHNQSKGIYERRTGSRSSQTEKLRKLNREFEENQKRTDRLYEAVEKGLFSLDPSLTERAHKLGAQRQAILTEIAGIKRGQEMPLKTLTESQVDGF